MMVSELFQLDWGDDMSKEMSFLNIGNEIFEVVDAQARTDLDVLTGDINEFIDDHNQDAAETVLWSGHLYTAGDTITINDLLSTYDYIEVHTEFGEAVHKFNASDSSYVFGTWLDGTATNGVILEKFMLMPTESNGSTTIELAIRKWSWSGASGDNAVLVDVATGSGLYSDVIKIVGLKNVANAELLDIRVGADGTTYQTAGQAIRSQIQQLSSRSYGEPTPVSLIADMTDETKIYVYVGSEQGYSSGHWYYYDADNENWEDGGQYGGSGGGSVTVDSALSSSSTNPVQNKVINTALGNKANTADVIAKPASPTSGQFLVFNGTAWVAQTLAQWSASSY